MLILLAAGLGVLAPAPQAALAASTGAVSISAGDDVSCAINSGKAYCWGGNGDGELGDGSNVNTSLVPVAVDTGGVLAGKTLTQIAAGADFACALDSAGAAYCWGRNGNGELGHGSTVNSSVPVAVDTRGALAGKVLTQITAGFNDMCALDSTGAAYCWGDNQAGQLGNGTTTDASIPVAVDAGVLAGKTLTRITAGFDDACALDSTGAAYCWGWNNQGQLGNGTTTSSRVPVTVDASGVLAGKTLTQIASDAEKTCAVDSAGAAYCWGENFSGELGDGTTTGSTVPVAVDASGALSGKSLTRITSGAETTCALDSAGAAYCWGRDLGGELGDGHTTSSSVPVAVDTSGVLAGKILTQITAGAEHTCAADAAGAAYCWGQNATGDLGDDTTTDSDVPVLTGPQAPAGITAVPGHNTVTVSWTAPASLDGGTLTGYTATAAPGGQTCTTSGAVTCTITGLADGTVYSVTVVAHTTAGDSGASAAASVTPGSGLAFTSEPADTVSFGVAFSFTVTTAGSPVPKITKTGRLPSGVRFADNKDGTATIAGTPANTAGGAYPVTLTARNTAGTITQAFTLTVTRAPAIKKIPATTATVGISLHLAITATGYPAPALAESGPLPAGLALTDNRNGTAALTGTPATGSGGRYPLTITATSTLGTASRAFTLKVDQAPAITSTDTASAVTGSAFRFQITATGFPAPRITKSGSLPRGVTFKSAAGAFTGTPRAGTSGSYPITITATNTSGTITQNFTLTVT